MKNISLALLAILVMAGSVFAAGAVNNPPPGFTMEFYTYNGYTPVKIAFQKIALIFSDNNYKSLFITACGVGIVISVFSTSLAISKGACFSPVAWAIPVMVGIVLYFAFIVKKGNIIIHDPATNWTHVQSGIPNGIVLVAGIMNRIERGVVDMIYTSSTPGYSYEFYAGGMGFNVMLKATGAAL